jgi:hypothetical protein
MKKFVAIFFLLLCAASLHAKDKPNPADFNIKIHISASHFETIFCGGGFCNHLYVDTSLNAKKIVLSGLAVHYDKSDMLIVPGDYQVKLTKDNHNSDSTLLGQEYDLLLPDGTIWHCVTTGIS